MRSNRRRVDVFSFRDYLDAAEIGRGFLSVDCVSQIERILSRSGTLSQSHVQDGLSIYLCTYRSIYTSNCVVLSHLDIRSEVEVPEW